MLGSPVKQCQDEEKQMALVSRKSIVAARNIQVGEIIHSQDLLVKRPGNGIASKFITQFVGKKAIKFIGMDQQISFEDIA